MRANVVILGAGFAGLELSARLSAELADRVEVTLIDQSDSFLFGFSKLDVMFARRTMDEVRIFYRTITKPGVTFRQETVRSIDPGRKRVVTDADVYDADVLVVALGADLDPGATPGLDECGYEFYSPDGAARLRDLLPAFAGGNVVIAVLGGFFKCPPAPYETAVLLHEHLSGRGVRDATTIHLITPMPKPIPISDETSDALIGLLDERGIGHSHACWITRLDPAAKVAHLTDGRELPFDLFLAEGDARLGDGPVGDPDLVHGPPAEYHIQLGEPEQERIALVDQSDIDLISQFGRQPGRQLQPGEPGSEDYNMGTHAHLGWGRCGCRA